MCFAEGVCANESKAPRRESRKPKMTRKQFNGGITRQCYEGCSAVPGSRAARTLESRAFGRAGLAVCGAAQRRGAGGCRWFAGAAQILALLRHLAFLLRAASVGRSWAGRGSFVGSGVGSSAPHGE